MPPSLSVNGVLVESGLVFPEGQNILNIVNSGECEFIKKFSSFKEETSDEIDLRSWQ
jgi:hypothetical protein